MSFGVGIGDVWFLLQGAVTVWNGIRDAPEELRAAVKDMELMKVTLKAIENEI